MSRELVTGGYAGPATAVTAAGAGDNTAVTGAIFDRDALNWPRMLTIWLNYTTTLAAGKSLFFKNVIVEHDDVVGFGTVTTYKTLEDATGHAISTSAGGGTVTNSKGYDVHLGGAKRFVRVKFTPDLDASGTDTANIQLNYSFSQMYKYPAV